MTTLMQAHHEWATRPDDERFTSLDDLLKHTRMERGRSSAATQRNKLIEARPVDGDPQGIVVAGLADDCFHSPTHWAFGQLCSLVGAPASYLRSLPSDLASDCINQSMTRRRVDTVGFLERAGATLQDQLRVNAITGPGYGRIWNEQIVEAVRSRVGSGPSAMFTVPGEFGKHVDVTKKNTTLFAGDRDMFIFLADERNRIEVPNRRGGQAGSLARGFFIRNSEVGASALRVGTFLFDYVCANRIVWGAENYQEVSIRHSPRAPDRWIDEVAPAIEQLASDDSSMFAIEHQIQQAQARYLDPPAVDKVLAKRFTSNQAKAVKLAHWSDEGRPMENAWDVVTGATAYARGLTHQDNRIDIERKAGAILQSVSA